MIADVADGLAAAHAAGIVHRDVKPENVLLDLAAPPGPGGAPRAKLTDFGIARLVDAPRRTRATRIIGTPDYLAPEIIEGLEPRAAVDIYALATVLYELLVGSTPFGGGHTGAVLRRHVTESVPPVPGLPDGLWRIIAECLAKAPASRLRAAELAERLREQLPALAGLPGIVVPAQGRAPVEEALTPAEAVYAEVDAGPGTHKRRRGPAVPLVPVPSPDSTRDTHTSLRRPSAQELASYAAESRAQRTAANPTGHRKGRRALVRRRRLLAVVIAVVLLLAGAAAAWTAFAADADAGTGAGSGAGTGRAAHAAGPPGGGAGPVSSTDPR